MTAYYNEIDRYKAEWLRELIKAKLIADGEVDERSIADVLPADIADFTQCHWFAGIGVWSYALRSAGWSDDRAVWTASCPCQPFSNVGKRTGFADERHLWPYLFHFVGQRKPDVLFGEQVGNRSGRAWFDLVSSDLEAIGYEVGAAGLSACGFGAPHERHRIYFVGDTGSPRLERHTGNGHFGSGAEWNNAPEIRPTTAAGATRGFWFGADWVYCRPEHRFKEGSYRPVEPGTFPLAAGTPERMELLRGYGDSLCAPVATAFIRAYLDTLN